MRYLHTVFHSGLHSLHSHQKWMRAPLSSHSCPHLLLFVFLLKDILTSVRWYFIVVLNCISLMMNNVENLSMCLLASLCLFWKDVFPGPLPIFQLDCWIFDVELYEFFCIFRILVPYRIYHLLKYFLPFSRLPIHFVDSFLGCANAF